MKYQFYLNQRRDNEGRRIALLNGFTWGDPLQFAYEAEMEIGYYSSFNVMCEEIFKRFGINHSMCVGDVIVFCPRNMHPTIGFTCDIGGFSEIRLEGKDFFKEYESFILNVCILCHKEANCILKDARICDECGRKRIARADWAIQQ